MQKKINNEETNRIKKIGIIAAIVILATFISFFAIVPSDVHVQNGIAGCIAIVVVEIVYFAGLMALENVAKQTEQVMMRVGAVTVLSLGSIFSILFSIIWLYDRRLQTHSFISIQIVFILIMLLLFMLFYFSSASVLQKNVKTMEAVNTVQNMITELGIIKSKYFETGLSFEIYKSQIDGLIEELTYSDHSVLVSEDTEIMRQITTLKDALESKATAEHVSALMTEIKCSVEVRKVQTKAKNSGTI